MKGSFATTTACPRAPRDEKNREKKQQTDTCGEDDLKKKKRRRGGRGKQNKTKELTHKRLSGAKTVKSTTNIGSIRM